ncbi:MAG: DUF5687 family protein [Ignavibacteriaceae bacterium]
MIRKLILHQWKSYTRSPERGENIFSFIVMGLLFLILAFYAITAGYFLPSVLEKLSNGVNPVQLFNSGLIYFIAFSFFFRIFLQGFPSQAVKYYRALPVKRKTLITALLLKTITNYINIVFILFLVSFTIKAVIPHYTFLSSMAWMFSIIAIELCNSFFTFLLKKKIFSKPTLLLPIIIILIIAIGLEFLSSASTAQVVSHLFNSFLNIPAFSVLPLLLLAYMYLLTFRWIDKNYYPEDLGATKREKVKSYSRYSFLENYGEVGSYIALELKMIFRNKRPRALFYYSLIFFVYPSFIYKQYFDEAKPVYPKPHFANAAVESSKLSSNADVCKITFNVNSRKIPKGAYVYISGNNHKLGGNNPASVNLYKNAEGNWERTFIIEKGKVLDYNFSLGSQNVAALDSTGNTLPKSYIVPWSDTTININIANWKTPSSQGGSIMMIVFWTIFIISYAALMYGQYLFAWEGGYFDFILSQKVNIKKYIEAKYYIMAAASFLAFAIMMVYIYMSIDLLWLNIAALFYSLGVNSVFILFLGTYNRKRMDLNASMMSQQGRDGFKQFLRNIPMILLMLAIYFALTWLGLKDYMPFAFGGIGLIALLFHKQLMDLSIKNFEKHRYEMAVGFREK